MTSPVRELTGHAPMTPARREVTAREWQRSAPGNCDNQDARIGGPEGMIMMRKLVTALAAVPVLSLGLALPASAAVPMAHATSCGAWRWPVKTGSDADRFKVDKTAIVTTIHHLRSLKAPSSFAGHQRRRFRGAERHTWQLDGVRLTAYRIEDDSDIHLVIRNAAGKTMIAEIPSPRCVSRNSLWRSQIAAARRTFMARDHATTSWKRVHQRITLRGLGFFDEIHDVTGQAPNGIELHPVTRVRF